MSRGIQDLSRSLPVTEVELLVSDEQRYRGIFEHAIEGIFQTTADGRYLSANPALARIYGYDSPEDLQRGLRDIGRQLYVRSGRRAEFLAAVDRDGKVSNFESQVYRKDGSTIWISENTVAVRDDFGRLLYYEGFVVDISARHAAEAALEEARADLERSLAELRATQQQVVQQERLHALGGMVTGVAHDFNNALSLILGNAELLQHECRHHPVGHHFAEYGATIVTAALDAAKIVNRLREFHRPAEPGEAREPVALNAVIDQAVTFTRPRWSAESHASGMPVEVVTDLGVLPPVVGNSAELREMLANLILNAVDAMPQGGMIVLRTRTQEDRIELAVTDTGTGMTEEVRRRCLEPFFTTKGDRGSGLGLSMVYGIVERHQGTVAIESWPGRGTTFLFTFPTDVSGAVTNIPAPAKVARPLRILVVDDEVVQGELIAHALQRDLHTIVTAVDGQEALTLFERQEFDLVITDKAMPRMNGDQLAVAVKSREPATRVILLTGFSSTADDPDGQSEFVDLVVAKPASLPELRAAIARVME